MRRSKQLAQPLFSIFRALHTSCGRAFSSASDLDPGASARFPAWLSTRAPCRIGVPLTEPLQGVIPAHARHIGPDPPPTEVTRLANGATIISEASPGPTASLSIYVDCGSVYETPSNSGSSALLECMAFKGSRHRDAQSLMTQVDAIGANVLANASREQIGYSIDCLRSHSAAALELLCDAVLNPSLEAPEVAAQAARLEGLYQSPEAQLTLMNEAIAQTAYEGALAQPLLPDPQQLSRLSSDTLAAFMQQHYTPGRMVLAGAGVDHQRLVELASPMLEAMPVDTSPPQQVTSAYVGGYRHLPGSFPQSNIILAFEYPGGWRDVQGSVVHTVLTYLMGGGSSFSSGGPGKGMHSRLYTRVLNMHHWCHNCSAFSSCFNTTGLVGISAASEPQFVHAMLDVMCHELESLTRPVPHEQLERAKAMTASMVAGALEAKAMVAEDLGRQWLTYGHRISGPEYINMIRGVTPKMVAELVRQLLGSPPAMVAFGDGTETLDPSKVEARLGGSGGRAGLRDDGGIMARLRQGTWGRP